MIYWAPLLHFYQPPTQFHAVLEKVCNESYRPLVELFQAQKHAEATINMNGVLTELLHQHNFGDVIEGFRELAERGQVELVESGKYHPILPLLPEAEVARQIELNHGTNRRFFGEVYQPKGFFPPEMAYGRRMLKPLIDANLKWLIVSGVACPVEWPTDVINEIEVDGRRIAVFFRDDYLSNMISFRNLAGGEAFLDRLEMLGEGKGDIYVITAMDAETFGHHIKNWETLFLRQAYQAIESSQPTYDSIQQQTVLAHQHRRLFQLQKILETQEIQVVTMSDLLDIFPRGKTVEPFASSWSTTAEDIRAGNPYPLWLDKGNAIHRFQWEHNNLCLELLNQAQSQADNDDAHRFADIARGLMDMAVHSDQYWWASRRPMWDINLVNKGLLQQEEVALNAYRSVQVSGASQGEKKDSYRCVLATRDLRAKIQERLLFDPVCGPYE
jgi:hypothetical protein